MGSFRSILIKSVIILGILSVISVSGYLIASRYTVQIGFPLDDAWIHQTYARNLIRHREWSYFPGQPSAGSTAPLWTGILAVGYWLGWGPYYWTFAVGWVFLLSIGILGAYATWLITKGPYNWITFTGLLLIFEWHNVWAAVSGMETLFFACLVLFCFIWIIAGWKRWWALGMLIGLSVWVRPDGITLLGPAAIVAFVSSDNWNERLSSIGQLAIGCFFVSFIYFTFNQKLAGAWLPNTFFAKQAEYAILTNLPLYTRFFQQALLPLIGVGILLLPGFVYYSIAAVKDRQWASITGVVWYLGYLWLYAIRLPVTYQHGRYIMPAMPVYFVFGVAGSIFFINNLRWESVRRVYSKVWVIACAGVLGSFWVIGGRAYASDVAFIESEMVQAALWIRGHSAPNALIAAHDIGAMGYFSDRRLLDLAGLVSPEVIPIMRDENALADFLDLRKADYLVTFPGWYPELVMQAEPIFNTEGEISPMLGGENMVVYRWGE